MTPAASISDRDYAVMLRGCIEELRYPRLCASRLCRRHHRCRDIAPRDPHCAALLHPVDRQSLVDLCHRVIDIVTGHTPPRASIDPVENDREDEAIVVLWDCIDDLPSFRAEFIAWFERYAQPPAPPVPPAPPMPPVLPLPPEEKQALLADISREMAHIKAMDDACGR